MNTSLAETARTMQALRAIHVGTVRERAVRSELRRLFLIGDDGALSHRPVLFAGNSETRGIAFIEGSGGGKSTAILKVLREFEPLGRNPETEAPRWLHVKVESPATLRSLGGSILKMLGMDAVSERAKVYDVWDLVRFRLRTNGLALLWLDEAHDLFRKTRSAETASMLKMLKSLMQGDHPVVLILSGTERLGDITGLDPQVNRRFAKIRPKALDFASDGERMEGLVRNFAREAGLDSAITGETVQRLIHGGRHRFGRCIEMTLRAIECALEDGAETLGEGHFGVAYAQAEGCEIPMNVFAADDWASIVHEDEDSVLAAPGRARRGRGARP